MVNFAMKNFIGGGWEEKNFGFAHVNI